MTHVIDACDPSTWPLSLSEALADINDVALAYELDAPGSSLADYEWAVDRISEALTHLSIRGWHCTNLSTDEIKAIREQGMAPLSSDMAVMRVNQQRTRGALSSAVAEEVAAKHQAGQPNRNGRTWFCFFPPRKAGQGGIERLLRYWGGEAVYWAHLEHCAVSEELRHIGTPAIIEVELPIASIERTFTDLPIAIIRRHLFNKGAPIRESLRSEGYTRELIPASRVRAIHVFPSEAFRRLSGCDSWTDPL
ncbi:hypothetical protein [Luteibacter sahnii]|uniref:hypothetical protein n=1 Tax=Luteibacter sahnii TaxID=3021977 RepID=UPI002A750AA4|nr:hypothetical protein [Luteibacter sp. PPL193]MDY1550143.1 hypothetical protein [Luteibacter sp. PPL193]